MLALLNDVHHMTANGEVEGENGNSATMRHARFPAPHAEPLDSHQQQTADVDLYSELTDTTRRLAKVGNANEF